MSEVLLILTVLYLLNLVGCYYTKVLRAVVQERGKQTNETRHRKHRVGD